MSNAQHHNRGPSAFHVGLRKLISHFGIHITGQDLRNNISFILIHRENISHT